MAISSLCLAISLSRSLALSLARARSLALSLARSLSLTSPSLFSLPLFLSLPRTRALSISLSLYLPLSFRWMRTALARLERWCRCGTDDPVWERHPVRADQCRGPIRRARPESGGRGAVHAAMATEQGRDRGKAGLAREWTEMFFWAKHL